MASIERTAYPRFKRYYTPHELEKIYTPTKAEIAFALKVTTGSENYFNLLVLLKVFQRLGYFPQIADIPRSVIHQIRAILNLPEDVGLSYQYAATLSRHKKAIRSYLQVTPFNQKGKALITEIIQESCLRMDNPADLINVTIEELVKERYELPGFNTLDRLVNHIRNKVNQKLFSQIISQLNPEYIERLNDLLSNYTAVERSPYNELKKLPKQSTRNHLNDLIAHLTWLETMGEIEPYLQGLTRTKIKHFAGEAKSLSASEMKDMTLPKRLTLLLCLIYSAQVQTRDYLVEMFLKQIKKIHNRAIEELNSLQKKQQSTTEKLVSVLTQVLQVFQEDAPECNSWEDLKAIFQGTGGVSQLLTECEEINAYQGNNYLPLIWRFYQSHRSSFFRVFNCLKLASTSSDDKLVKALTFLLFNSHRRGEWLKNEVDLSFASHQWQKLILFSSQNQNVIKLSRRHFEVCVFSYLAAELKSGDICVTGSEAYADYREQLLSWKDCQPLVEPYCQQLGFPSSAEDFVEHLKSRLTETASEIDRGYPHNTSVVISPSGEPVLKRPAANL